MIHFIRFLTFIVIFVLLFYLNATIDKQRVQIKELQDCIVELRKADRIQQAQVDYFLNGGWK